MKNCSRALLLAAAVALATAAAAQSQDTAGRRPGAMVASDLLPGLANLLTGPWADVTPAFRGRSNDRHFHLGGATDADFYLLGGSGGPGALRGNVSSLAVGAGYRQPLNDSVSWHLDLRNHLLQRDYFGDRDTASNFELSVGLQLSF